jgi:hypothetical protein
MVSRGGQEKKKGKVGEIVDWGKGENQRELRVERERGKETNLADVDELLDLYDHNRRGREGVAERRRGTYQRLAY